MNVVLIIGSSLKFWSPIILVVQKLIDRLYYDLSDLKVYGVL